MNSSSFHQPSYINWKLHDPFSQNDADSSFERGFFLLFGGCWARRVVGGGWFWGGVCGGFDGSKVGNVFLCGVCSLVEPALRSCGFQVSVGRGPIQPPPFPIFPTIFPFLNILFFGLRAEGLQDLILVNNCISY